MHELRLRLHDTMSGHVVPVSPERPGEVRVYQCGPTTYDVAHVGHARAALAPDVLVRHLRAQGNKVTFVRNITDVDDKILKRAKESGEEPMALSARMAKLYQDDMAAMGNATPDVEPKVSESIGDIIHIVQELIGAGSAYEVVMPDGTHDVYYAVRTFPTYGKLSKRNIDDLEVGARVEANESKRDPLDFALWKGCTEAEWGWPSPWGKGRPGWHIECSAMSSRYLGHGFEIHTGGMDLVFPHHENEIAQSEAVPGACGPFVKIWMHNGFVNVDKEKMAKSLGNFVTVRQVYERNDPEALRYFLLSVHYRGPIAFETEKLENGRVIFPGVIEAERRVDYLYQTLARLRELAGDAAPALPVPVSNALAAATSAAKETRKRVDDALDDDLNTSVAVAALAEAAKAGNELADLAQKRRKDLAFVKTAAALAAALEQGLRDAFVPLGLLQTPAAAYTERTRARRLGLLGLTATDVEAKLRERTQAREAKDFARSDAIRMELSGQGIEVHDTQEGSTYRVAP